VRCVYGVREKDTGLKSLTTWVLMIECPVSMRHPSKRGELKSPPLKSPPPNSPFYKGGEGDLDEDGYKNF